MSRFFLSQFPPIFGGKKTDSANLSTFIILIPVKNYNAEKWDNPETRKKGLFPLTMEYERQETGLERAKQSATVMMMMEIDQMSDVRVSFYFILL